MNKKYLFGIALCLAANYVSAEGYDRTVIFSAATGTNAKIEFRLNRGDPGTGILSIQPGADKPVYSEPVSYSVEWGTAAKLPTGGTVHIVLKDQIPYTISCDVSNVPCVGDGVAFRRDGIDIQPAFTWARKVEN